MFDESLNPPPYVDLQAPEVIAPIPEVVAPEHAVSTGSPSSTTVDQDAPSPKVASDQSSSSDVIHTIVPPDHQVKLDELGGILKNKARLVAHGYRQEQGIDFEESFCSGSKIRGYTNFSSICCSYEYGRLSNGCKDYVSE
ncbi:hypothetical protein Tco_0125222, partial [Tanacetum coccineum]